METILEEYFGENAKKLHIVVDKILKKFGGISNKDYDDFYSLAGELFAKLIKSYSEEKGKFDGFFYSCLDRKIKTEITARNREKRRSDRESVSIYTPIGDDGSILADVIEDKKIIESNFVDKEDYSRNVDEYLSHLSDTQKTITDMILSGYSHSEIKTKLGINKEKFDVLWKDMTSFEKKQLLKQIKQPAEDEEMDYLANTQTFEKSKTNRISIASLIKKINNQTIRFNHPLQRPSDQWTPAMKGNLVSDILQGNPIPALVFAEQIINGLPIIWDLDGKQRSTNAYSFSSDGYKITKNVRRWDIPYQAIVKDDSGEQILDNNGFPMSKIERFDIRGKKFSDLPEELKDKFLDYNFEIVQYINCSSEDIAYHIARYNEGKSMSVSHKGIIHLGEEFATTVKSISAMPFFKEMGGYTVSESTNGTVDRVVVESIMASYYLDDWKKSPNDMCDYIREHLSQEQFEEFEDMVDRIAKVGDEDVFAMFNSKNSFLYFSLFYKFTKTGINDEKFIEFMGEFQKSLHSKKVDGITYDSLCVDQTTGKARSTKDRTVVTEKIEMLEKLMCEYLHINIEETLPIDMKSFIIENVSEDITDSDMEFYEEILSDLTLNVDNNSRLLSEENKPSMVAIVAYGCKNDIDLDDWIVQFFSNNFEYYKNQKENYIYMKQELEKYVKWGKIMTA